MVLNTKYVDWQDRTNDLVALCHEFRQKSKMRGDPVGGKNLAILRFRASWKNDSVQWVVGVSDPIDSVHSEKNAVDALASALDNAMKTATIVDLYTERAPCRQGPGMKDCDAYLQRVFIEYGQGVKPMGKGYCHAESGIYTPVYWSFIYPSGGKTEVQEFVKVHKELGFRDEPDTMTFAEFGKMTGKQDRAEVRKILKDYDKTL